MLVGRSSHNRYNTPSQALPLPTLKFTPQAVNVSHMAGCGMSYHHSKNKERLRRIENPTTPRYGNLHLDCVWKVLRTETTDRPDRRQPFPLRSFVSLSEFTTQSRSYFLRFRPVVVPHSLSLLPLLACTLLPPRRAFLPSCDVFRSLLLSRQL